MNTREEQKTGKPSIFNLLDDKYVKSTRILKSYNKIASNIGRLNYFLNSQEMNAYFGTLDNIVKTIIEKESINKDNIKYD